MAGSAPVQEKPATFRDKLSKLGALAKKIGIPLLAMIQGAAYGGAGIDKKTFLEEQRDRQAKLKETEEGRRFLAEQGRLDRQFSAELARINSEYQRTRDEKQAQQQIAEAKQAHEYRLSEIAAAAQGKGGSDVSGAFGASVMGNR